jgi:ribosomal protein S18 acetylase RimI-like enzyme
VFFEIRLIWHRNAGFGLMCIILLSGRTVAARRAVREDPADGGGEAAGDAGGALDIRAVRRGDLPEIIAIDASVTGIEKRRYWNAIYRRYGVAGDAQRQFLVADDGGAVVGFVIGEVRDWEFGSPPCGWVFGIDVRPEVRQRGVGARLLAAIAAGFRRAGVTKIRTMLARDNTLILSFFRSQGMMAGPFISLEMDIEPGRGGRR